MNDKPFKTFDELIELLSIRGIDIKTSEAKVYAKNILIRHGYYNVINVYKNLFLDKTFHPISDTETGCLIEPIEKYKEGTTINEIYALYEFDRAIRNLFLKYILKIETHVKNLIAYYFSMEYGHNNYLRYNNFNNNVSNAPTKITELIAEIQRQISSRSNDPSISHYLTHYGYVPLWVLNNILTFGTISKFYSLMKTSERSAIAKNFSILDKELESELFYISTVRNFCAHGNRLYCYRTKHPLINTSQHDFFEIEKNSNNEYINGKRDLFAAYIAMKQLLPANDYKTLKRKISENLYHLRKKLVVIKIEDVLSEMGFPKNWKK